MYIPPNFTEEQVLCIIDKVVNALASAFRFGYFDTDDIKQTGRLFALQALEKYDTSRKLEPFLYVHVRNRLISFKRDKLRRHELPCRACPFFDPELKKSTNQCALFADKMECDKYNRWKVRNDSKANIMEPADIENINDEREKNMRSCNDIVDTANLNEMIHKIDTMLPASMRGDYLKMRAGISIPKQRRMKIKEECKKILSEEYDA